MKFYSEDVVLKPVITLKNLMKLIPDCPIDSDDLILDITFNEGLEDGSYLNLDEKHLTERAETADEAEAIACTWLAKAIKQTGVSYGEDLLVCT